MFLLLFSLNTFKVTICDLKNKDRNMADNIETSRKRRTGHKLWPVTKWWSRSYHSCRKSNNVYSWKADYDRQRLGWTLWSGN